jgi:RHS repeat-associated protein
MEASPMPTIPIHFSFRFAKLFVRDAARTLLCWIVAWCLATAGLPESLAGRSSRMPSHDAVPVFMGENPLALPSPVRQIAQRFERNQEPAASTQLTASTQTVSSASVQPILNCVANYGNGNYIARFGYQNNNSSSVTILVGTNNSFTPAPSNQGQPTTFKPGPQNYVFNVLFNGTNLSWYLKGPDNVGRSVTASSSSTACTSFPAPTANAGANQTVATGSTVHLDGTGSTDPGGLTLTYQWCLSSVPSGSSARLSSATAAKPTFVADKTGTYKVQLIVSDSHASSAPSFVTITSQVVPPVANAGPNQTVATGSTVHLDGTGSTDPAGLPLSYQWSFVSKPSGSTATLSSTTAAKPTFVADKTGTYKLQLSVCDGHSTSAPSTVVITSEIMPPVANAGPGQTVALGSTVQLDGSGSTDPAGLALTYQWSFVSKPTGSTAALSGSTMVKPTFVADKSGNYTVQLVVTDKFASSTPSTVLISTQVVPPVANAGVNQTVASGTTVHLDGSKSTDANGLPLTYLWSFVSVPSGSAATLSNPTSVQPTFVTDKVGNYVVQLVVNNGTYNSTPSQVTISDTYTPPTANAGPNQSVQVEAIVQLDGSHSTDLQGYPLTYSWSILTTPAGSTAALSNPQAVQPAFKADLLGNYVIQLIVNDGVASSQPSTVTISTSDVAPVANPGPAQTVNVSTLVTLDGSASTDSDGQPLGYSWTMTTKPAGSSVALVSPATAKPTFFADLPGTYVIQLIVNDGFLNSLPASVTISTNDVPPVANPGPNQTVNVGATVQLDGTGSTDSDTKPLTYTWAVLSQPPSGTAALSSPTAAKPTFVPNVAGLYVVQLIVNDGFLNSPPATTTITANPVNQPPVVSAGLNQTITLPTNTVTLNGSATDDGLPNNTLIIQWSLVSGPATVTFSSPNTAVSQATFTVAGTYVLQLSASDTQYTTTSNTTITVNPQVNQPPVVNAGPNQTIVLPVNSVTLNGTVTDDGLPNGTLIISWSGPAGVTFNPANKAVTTASFPGAGTYVLTLSANDSQYTSTSNVTVIVSLPPVPIALPVLNPPNQSLLIGAPVQLDGSGSSDPSHLPLTYQWSFASVPTGSVATLSGPTTAKPAFIPDLVGSYRVQLVVNNGFENGLPATLTLSASDVAPTANAGPNQTVTVGATVQLNGSGSTDVDGHPLTYQWTIASTPTGSHALLANASTVTPTFVADLVGNYSIQLVVNDGFLNSQPSLVTISTTDTAPVANAGPNQSIVVGTTVQLDGSGSTDVDSQPVTYLWSFVSVPQGSNAVLSNSTAVQPTFYADMIGTYVVQLIVNDGFLNSSPAKVTITTGDTPPVANPGPVQNVPIGGVVTLDGTGSSSATGKPLTYLWALLSKPANSTASLSLATSPHPYFTADLAGAYVVQLIVNDGFLSSPPATVMISTIYAPPIANPGSAQNVNVGATVTLDGSGSTDPENYPLTYTWAILSQPSGGTASLSSATAVKPTFIPNVAGLYVIQLIVNDGVANSAPVTVPITATAVNQPPVVNAGPNQTITLPVNSVTLNGSATDDGLPNGTLILQWTKVSGPGTVTFSSPNTAVTKATFSSTGAYVLQLSANDSQYTSTSTATITVNAPPVNQPPVVSAGRSQTIQLPTNTVTLQGTATDDGLPSGILIISWSEVAGPGVVSFGSPATATTTVSFPGAGVYLLRLTANDTQLSSSSDVVISVQSANGANQPPVVSAGPDLTIVLPTNSVVLKGEASDDGLPSGQLNTTWTQLTGPVSASIASPNSLSTQATFVAAGTYTFQLSASDTQLSSSASMTVVVYPASGKNQPPYVNAGPDQTVILPNGLLLNGVAVDDGLPNGTLVVGWQVLSGPGPVTLANSQSASTTATFSVAGEYVLQLAASDSQLSSSSIVHVHVLALSGSRTNRGTDFWLAFPTNYNYPMPIPNLYISSDVATSGTVSIPGLNFSQSFTLPANGTTTVTLPGNTQLLNLDPFNTGLYGKDLVQDKGIHVTSQNPVSISALDLQSYSTDGYLALPLPMLGTDYITLGYKNVFVSGIPTQYGSDFAIVAPYDGTTVTITPSTETQGRKAGVPYSVILNQGRTYELVNDSTLGADLSGTVIHADKPVGVFSGHWCANIGTAAACNELLEQLPPVDQWGNNFLALQFATRTSPYVIHVVASQDNTNVSVNGQQVSTLNHGGIYEGFLKPPASITSDKPVLVAQYAESAEVDSPTSTNGDPTMVLLQPITGYQSSYHVEAPPDTLTGFDSNGGAVPYTFKENYVNVSIPQSAASSLQMDGNPVDVSSFVPLNNTAFTAGSVALTPGAHSLSAGMPFGAIVYGFAVFDAYSYPGGISVDTVPGASLSLFPPASTQQTGTQHCAVGRIADANGVALGGIRLGFGVTGANVTQGSQLTDFAGIAQFCYAGTENGADTITVSAGNTSASGMVTWQTGIGNQPPYANAGQPQTILLPQTIILAGIATDDGLPSGTLTVQWSMLSGPGTVTFTSPASAETRATFSAAGTYQLQLSASDSQLTTTSQVTITVNTPAQNQAPVVNAGPNQTLNLNTQTDGMVTLNGSVTDDGLPAGTKPMASWTMVGCQGSCFGPGLVILSPTSAVTQLYFPPLQVSSGVWTFQLVGDDTQLTASSQVTVTVIPAIQPPLVTSFSVTPNPLTLPSNTVTATASVTDGNLPPTIQLTEQWTQIYGPAPVTFSAPNQVTTQVTFPQSGIYGIQLAASNGIYTSTGSAQITVNPAAQAPTVSASASPSTITLPANSVTLNGTATQNGQSTTLTYAWAQSAGPAPATIASPSQLSTSASFTVAGSYTFSFTATAGQVSNTTYVSVSVNPVNKPPVVSAGPNQSIALPNATVTLSGSATDDGLPVGSTLTVAWSEVSGPAAVTFSAPASAVTQATFTVAGTYDLRLSANDTQYTSTSDVMVTVTAAPQNQPPTVFAGLNQTITLPQTTVYLNGSATDDGLPAGSHLTIVWSELSGPASVTFSNGAYPQTYAYFTMPGVYVVQLSANDTQYTSTSTVTVTVNPPINQPPLVYPGNAQTVTQPTNSVTLNGTVTDDGLPIGGTLTEQWTQLSGPAACTFATPNQPVTQVTCSAVGTYYFQLSANDGQLTSSSATSLTINAAEKPPLVSAGPNQVVQLPANAVTLSGSVTPGFTGQNITVTWTELYGPAAAVISSPNQLTTLVTFTGVGEFVGSYQFQLTATDGVLTSTANVGVTVNPASAPPVAQILTPADGTEITKPVVVTGNVSPVNWFVEYSPNTADGPSGVWTQFARVGQSANQINDTTLGTFDPTLLPNGSYTIRLTANNQFGQTAVSSVTVTVARNMKVGLLQLAFNDLTVPVAGVPMQIIRSYNSLDRGRSGDFGLGWSLSLSNIRLQKNRVIGKNWNESVQLGGYFPQYCLDPIGDKNVTITFPDGRVYSFAAGSGPECQSVGPISAPTLTFTELPGSAGTAGATLVPADGGLVNFAGSVPGSADLLDYSGQTYNPTLFVLTTADGTAYTIDQFLGLTKLVDRSGNTLTITASGIISSTGQSITFKRDSSNRITEIDDPNGNRLLYGYNGGDLFTFQNATGQLTRFGGFSGLLYQIYPPGQTTPIQFNYDGNGRLIGTADPLAGQIQFQPDIPNQRQTTIDRNGNSNVYEYDGDGNITKVTDALGNITTSTFDANDNQLSQTNALGKTSTYTYDGLGNRTSETDPMGHTTTYSYNARKQPLTAADPNGNTTTNVYDSNGNLTSTKDPLGNTTANTYFSSGLLQSSTDALNHTTIFAYDTTGNLTSQTDALSNITTYTYDANGNRKSQAVSRTKSDGTKETLTTQYQYDGNNRLTKTLNPDGSSTQVQYDPLGRQSATIDALNHTTSYTYDADGHLTQTNYPDSTSESATYDANGNRLTSTDRSSHKTTFTYDKLNRLTATTFADNSTTSTTYDAIGQVLTAKDANGNVTKFGYDDAGRRTSVTDALTHTTTFAYDAAGNQLSATDANTHTTQYQYDALNRRTMVTYPDSKFETTAYDALGRVISRTDAKGLTTQYGYDNLARLTTVTVAVTGALNQVTSYGYDEVGNRITQTDANQHTTSYAYDQLGRRIQRKLPMGQTESYTYDANGNLKSRTDFNGRTTAYAYDNLNRLLIKTADAFFATNHLGAASVSFTYNALGQRATMADASGTTNYAYDNRNRLTSKATPEGTLTYTYDAAGDVKTIQSSNAGGANLAYAYDALNRLSTATDPVGATAYTYDNVGNLQTVTYPNSVAHTYGYDSRNRLTNLGVAGTGGQLAGYSYLLDATGHRLSVSELSGRTVNYGYDNLYRLTGETIAADPGGVNGASSYAYDLVGNRTQKVSTIPGYPGGASSYNANDQLGTDTYDADGNTMQSVGLGYAYDFENHLVQQAGLTIVYDGDGNRVAKTSPSGMTQFLVDMLNPTGYAQVMEELQTGAVTRTYTWGLELISERQPTNSTLVTSFYVFDGHGSVRALTDSTGAVTDTYDYDAFGNLLHSTGTTPNNYLYSGEQFDPDLNLYYNRGRYLNTSTGRFWSMDSYEGDDKEPTSLHKYLYVGGDPVNRLDPSGRDFLDTLGAAAITVGTLANQAAIVTTTVLGTVYINLYRVPQVIETLSNYATLGLGAVETLRFLGSNALRYAESYSRIPTQRGLDYEVATQANLGKFFPGIDHFEKDSGVAVQVRTTTQTQTMDALLGVVNKGVNRLNNLPEEMVGPDRYNNQVTILRADIKERALLVGIPAKPVPWNFGVFLQRIREISESEKIAIAIQAVENVEGETFEK